MERLSRTRLAGAGATLLLLASIGAPVAQASTRPAQAPVQSPYRVLGTPSGELYASGRPGAGRAGQDRAVSGASIAGPRTGARNSVQPASQPAANTIRPLAAPAPTLASLTTAPDNHATGFAGLAAGDEPSPTTEPADSTVAVGPDEVVQVANLVVRVTDRAGTPSGPDIPLPSFFSVGPGYFDRQPRVIYDSLHGRFVMTESTWDCTPGTGSDPAVFGHGYVDLAVSRTTDPNGFWDIYFWAYDDLIPQDPSIGSSTDKLAVSSNLSTMTHGDGGVGDGSCGSLPSLTPYGGDLLVASWADAVAHKASNLLVTEFAAPLADAVHGGILGLRAALQAPAASPTLYVVGRAVTSGTTPGQAPNDVIVTAFSGLPTKTANVLVTGNWNLTADSVVAPFADPSPPHQPGSPATIVSGVDGFAQDALWQAGKLTWATTYPCKPGGDATTRDCVRLTQVDLSLASPSVDPTETQDALLARNGFDTYLPGIGISGDSTLEIVYSQSGTGAGNYPSSWQQYQRPADARGAFSPPVQLAAGSGTYPGTQWGAYVGLGQDPQVAGAVWQANASSAGAGYWSTFVDALGHTTGSTFSPITPTRIVDSRDGSGLSGLSGKFVSANARTFQVAGLGPIPGNAVAITGNVTVTRQNAAGYVAVTPMPQNNPSSSTLNFPLGDTRANNVTVPLSAAGNLSMTYVATAGRTADLILDVTGYFLPNNSSATYHPVPPTRLLNSVTGIGQPGGTPAAFQAGIPQTFTIGTSSPVPVAATAITGNLTVTDQTKPGYLSITPDATPSPGSSNLNFPLGDNRANGFTAPLNTGHQLSIVYSAVTGATADVILDVTGYYLPDLSGLHFYPLNPGRILDSRTGAADSGLSGLFASSVPRDLAVTGHWGVPAGAQTITGNLTVVSQTTRGYVAATVVADPNPSTSTLNFPIGDIRANGMTVPLDGSGGLFLVFKGTSGSARTNLIIDVSGYFQ